LKEENNLLDEDDFINSQSVDKNVSKKKKKSKDKNNYDSFKKKKHKRLV
jgi:hypothetical protein